VNGHACRWCGLHDCPDRTAHERLHAGSESTWRYPDPAQRFVCPHCGTDVRVATPCVAAFTAELAAAVRLADELGLPRVAVAVGGA
jgi:hypothetical protein